MQLSREKLRNIIREEISQLTEAFGEHNKRVEKALQRTNFDGLSVYNAASHYGAKREERLQIVLVAEDDEFNRSQSKRKAEEIGKELKKREFDDYEIDFVDARKRDFQDGPGTTYTIGLIKQH